MRLTSYAFCMILIMIISSCKKDEDETLVINPCGIDFESTVHYAAIGDEFSSGLYIAPEEAWSSRISEFIVDQGFTLSVFTQIGDNGDTAAELSSTLNTSSDANCKNLITLMAGANDQMTGRTAAQFQEDFSALLARAISITGSADRVICVTIPDYSVTPGLPASAGSAEEAKADIIAFNEIIMAETELQGARLADIYPISESAYQFLYVPEDSLHADGDQHGLWANVISAEVLQSLN